MGEERRVFERESVAIRFLYSLDSGSSLHEGEWKEAETVDIGPVLVGGLAFYSENMDIQADSKIRIALFMDLETKKVWEQEEDMFPVIYQGKVCRIFAGDEGQRKIAIVFKGFEQDPSHSYS